ncbi:hypothetical protein [Frankia sp. R82]|uniref:hypothetical protein n=1 Tax=Frankia sp. R82 TaxID=2950553 RepID=UPI002042F9EF|nr:hypothetical protein [Frankia sp. R82]MCM3882218.1 hypothetical protein [Frankia sp. R82]
MGLTAVTLFVTPGVARADEETVCGYRTYDPDRDGLNLGSFLGDGQGRVNDKIRRFFGWDDWTCAPLRDAAEIGAAQIVGNPYTKIIKFRVKLPREVQFFLFVRKVVEHSGQAEPSPAELPAVGPSVIQAPVSWTGGAGLWLNSGPGSGKLLVVIPEQTMLTIGCQVRGPAVTGPYGRTDLWDYVTTPDGHQGFASDAFIFTNTSDQVAPAC